MVQTHLETKLSKRGTTNIYYLRTAESSWKEYWDFYNTG